MMGQVQGKGELDYEEEGEEMKMMKKKKEEEKENKKGLIKEMRISR